MAAIVRTLIALGAAGVLAQTPAPQDCAAIAPDAFRARVLKNSRGLELAVLPFGGTLQRLLVPTSTGAVDDILLGLCVHVRVCYCAARAQRRALAPPRVPPTPHAPRSDDATSYCTGGATTQHPYFGALIGRVANRIAQCAFTLGGVRYATPCNEHSAATGLNDTLHGGTVGYDRRVWAVSAAGASALELALTSPDGEEGFPSSLELRVHYSLLDPPQGAPAGALGALDIDYRVTNTGSLPTPAAPTNHAYFHLSGFRGEETVLAHILRMANATRYEAIDAGLIPTGELVDVTRTQRWMDFTAAKSLGRDFPLPSGAAGYDNAWVFAKAGAFVPQAELLAPASGLRMTMWTDAPSVQVYTGNFLNASGPTAVTKKRAQQFPGQGLTYAQHSAVTFEAQRYIGALEHPALPSIVLAPGGVYTQHTAYVLERA